MFAIPGLIALLAFVYLRPQEVVVPMQRIPFLYLFLLATLVGVALDVRLRRTRLAPSPLVPWGAAYFGWSGLSMALFSPGGVPPQVVPMFVSFFLFLAAGQSLQTARALRAVAAALLVLSLALAGVGVHQAFAPTGCVKQDDTDPQRWVPDGRSCTTREQCSETAIDGRGDRHRCERLGLLQTSSVEGRVRYRGIMEDPNELALVLSMALPFAFVPWQARRTTARLLLAVAALLVVGLCVIYTRSRSGQLAFLAALGAQFVRRLGWRGLAAGGILGAPVLLLGGRSDSAAEQSTSERLECWSVAIELFRGSPVVGVGKYQFTEHHYLTAHNSPLLALAEIGLPGLFLWSAVVYLAFKTVLAIVRLPAHAPGTPQMKLWGNALLSSMCAMVVSASFLSLTDHNVLWTYLGLVSALAGAARTHQPAFRVRIGWRDAALLLGLNVALIAAVFVYTRLKL